VSRRRIALIVVPVVIAAVLPASAPSQPRETLTGVVGPEAVITLRHADGRAVTQLDAGEYLIRVDDRSVEHNFHLFGPGVNEVTAVETTGSATWTVTFQDANAYTYQCDPHATTGMRGRFNVGNVPPPPPPAPAPTRLRGKVGPGKTISLKTASGARVTSLRAGRYRITAQDVTRADNFHLVGPGVNRKTTVRGKSAPTWTLTLRAGRHTYRSDKTRRLRKSFTVRR
jgi:Copper binding proteins, plastocyanin/azurin family